MKKVYLLGTAFFLAAFSVFAQSETELNKISFFPDVIHNKAFGEIPENTLKEKIRQIVLQNSRGATENTRFSVVGRVSLVDETLTPTVPPMYKVILEVDLIVADLVEKKTYGIYSFKNCVGVNKNRNRAAIQAIAGIRSNKDIKDFLDKAKKQIFDYYKNNCDFVITQASTLGEQKQYDKAIERLYGLPNISEDCFYMAQTKIVELERQKNGKVAVSEESQKTIKSSQPSDSLFNVDKSPVPNGVSTKETSDKAKDYEWLNQQSEDKEL